MGFAKDDLIFCRQCAKLSDQQWWIPAYRMSVCYKCKEAYQDAHPNWQITDQEKRVAQAKELLDLEEKKLEELRNDRNT